MNKFIHDDEALFKEDKRLKERQDELRKLIAKHNDELKELLPVEGAIVVAVVTGSAGNSVPIFSKPEENKYLFNSYGFAPPNYKEYENVRGYGMCGSLGHTDDIKLVAETIRLMNAKQLVIPCNQAVIDDLVAAGFQVEVTKRWGKN